MPPIHHLRWFIFLLLLQVVACQQASSPQIETSVQQERTDLPDWAIANFKKLADVNPVLLPSSKGVFFCPVRQEEVLWEVKDVFNPAAVVRDGKVYLIYRAEDTVGIYAGTSRFGLAISEDGYHFDRLPKPVFYPDNDVMKVYEWEGGVEDPRIVETDDGRYIMTYTAYDGKTARLCLASSTDLQTWQKHGLVLSDEKYRDTWSKSGAIVARREGDKIIATKINGKYWMYWGDTNCFMATSDDLLHWEPVLDETGAIQILFTPRPGQFDSRLVEPGPAPLLTDAGIVFIYNSMNLDTGGDPNLPAGTYTAGQVLLNKEDPTQVLARTDTYFFHPESEYELKGQINNVVFLEGLVPFNGKWLLYYGTADSKIAVAEMEIE